MDPIWHRNTYSVRKWTARLFAIAERSGAERRHDERPRLLLTASRYPTLPSRLGPRLDGPATFTDADAWYFILEGSSLAMRLAALRVAGAGDVLSIAGPPR